MRSLILVPLFIAYMTVGILSDHIDLDRLGVEIDPRIVNGKEAEPHSRPYQVWLTIDGTNNQRWACGGSLISNTYVLTAGHCCDNAAIITAFLGAHDITKAESTQVALNTINIIIHEKFNRQTIENDICVVELEPHYIFDDNYIRPVKLPSRNDVKKTYAYEDAVVSGWGLTYGFGNQVSPVLRIAKSKILSNGVCKLVYLLNIRDTNICLSGETLENVCSGDSGGPMTVDENGDEVQVGVVSFGARFCVAFLPSAYARVTSYLDWIEKNTDLEID